MTVAANGVYAPEVILRAGESPVRQQPVLSHWLGIVDAQIALQQFRSNVRQSEWLRDARRITIS